MLVRMNFCNNLEYSNFLSQIFILFVALHCNSPLLPMLHETARATFKTIFRSRRQLDGILMDHQLHRSTYFRIVGFCATYFLFAIPLSLWVLGSSIYNIATTPKEIVYASTHSDFWSPWRISDPVVDPMCYPAGVVGITWFMFFGTNQEAKRVYSWIWNRTGLAWACGNLKKSIGRRSDGISNNEGQLLFAT